MNPGYRRLAVSKEIMLPDIKKGVVWLAIKWGYPQDVISRLIEQISSYYNNNAPFNTLRFKMDQVQYWSFIESTNQTDVLRDIALSVFAIVIQSRGCESLFSMMGYVKTKFRNRYGDTY